MASLIVAMSLNRVIGRNNTIPWKLPADMKRFKQLTTGHPVIMGRKTFESIGKPLPNRTNIVLTRKQDYKIDGCLVKHTLGLGLELARGFPGSEEVFILGGEEVYRTVLENPFLGPVYSRFGELHVNKIYLTLVRVAINGDAFFPKLDVLDWEIVSWEKHKKDEKNEHDYDFIDFKTRVF